MRKKLVCIVFFFSINCITAQLPRLTFKHLNLARGLSNSTVEVLFQDSRGFIWIGTRDGLNRYDGSEVVVFKNDVNDPNSISDNYITSIIEDHQHNLWIGTTNGLNCFDPKRVTFKRYKHIGQGSLSHNYITSIAERTNGKLWIGTFGGGINVLDPSTEKCTYIISKANSLKSNFINRVFVDADNRVFVGTEVGVQKLENENLFWFSDLEIHKIVGKNAVSIKVINQDRSGNLVLGTNEDGLLLYNDELNSFRLFQHSETAPQTLGSNLVRSIGIAKNGSVWVGCINGGLNLLDPISGKFYTYQNDPNDPESLSQRTVSAILADDQSNLWVGTHRGGVNVFMPNEGKFVHHKQENGANNSIRKAIGSDGASNLQSSLSYNDVKSFCEDENGNIWIGTDGGGLNLYNRKSGNYTHFKYNPTNKATLGSNEVLDIFEDKKGNLWLSTWGGGLNKYNGNGTFTRFKTSDNPESISSNYVQKTFEDSKGNLWVGTYFGGLNLYDSQKKTFKRFVTGSGGSRIFGKNIVSIAEDRQGAIWVGTDDGGLNRIDSKTQFIRHYFNKEEKTPDLRVLFIDSKGRLWLGQKGLFRYDKTQDRFSLFPKDEALTNEFIKGIVEDEMGNLWISTSTGIRELNPESETVHTYHFLDDPKGQEFEANAALRTKDGEIYFGGINGYHTFYPKNMTAEIFEPKLYFTDFQLLNKKIKPSDEDSPLPVAISFLEELDLSYRQSTFTLGFASLNFSSFENRSFKYKLEDWDQDWVTAGPENKANYTNVEPGTYTFRLMTANNAGTWSPQTKALKITIHPPFYATWWFRILVLLLVSYGVFRLYIFRKDQAIQKLQEASKEEMHQMQLQFFTNISHEFRTPLSLILGPLEKLQQIDSNPSSKNYYKIIHRNATRLMSLINELMDFRKAESGMLKLNVMEGSIFAFLSELTEEFEEIAREKKIKFEFLSNTYQKEVWFDRQILEKIVINLLSNAFKYTKENGKITLEILDSLENYRPVFAHSLEINNEYQARNYTYIKVTDNGVGISSESIPLLFERYYRKSDAHLGSGIGLAFVKTLTLKHKGKINVYSERNQGTEIIISIPTAKKDYTEGELWVKNNAMTVSLDSIEPNYENHLQKNHLASLSKERSESSKPVILIVEDNLELSGFLKDNLAQTYQIMVAKDGQEGLELAKSTFPNLIISDIMMPVMNGIELCKRIKNDPETNHIPFIILTAKGGMHSKLEGVESGADYYFEKPLSVDLLELTLRNIFNQKSRLKEKLLKDNNTDIKEMVHDAKLKKFLDELIGIIESQLTDPAMNIDSICVEIGMSRTNLYNKIKSLTGQSIGDFIRTIRLRKAAQLLKNGELSITEVMYSVGIQTQSYFTKAFKAEFGKTPSQYVKEA